MKKLFFLIASFIFIFSCFSYSQEDVLSLSNKIAPGDLIEISVYVGTDNPAFIPKMPLMIRVSPSGTIKFPGLGEVAISGMDEYEAARKIETILKEKKLFLNPQVTIFLSSQGRAAKVTVLGAVNAAGNFAVTGPFTLGQAIAAAGGTCKWPPYIKPNLDHIRVLRQENGQQKTYVLSMDNDGRTFYVIPNDIVILDEYEPIAVRGDVAQPGTYRMRVGYTLADAVAEAGGVTKNADAHNLKVVRIEDGIEKEYILDLDTQGIYFLLKQHDRISVEAYGTVDIFGEVMAPGRYYIKKDLTVVHLIFVAGGFTDFANTGSVKIVRKSMQKGKEKKKVMRVPVKHIFKTGDLSKDMVLMPNDIVIVSESWF